MVCHNNGGEASGHQLSDGVSVTVWNQLDDVQEQNKNLLSQ